MKFEEKLAEYAKLIATMGVSVRKGQKVLLTCPLECVEFGRKVVRECYLLGASEVFTDWTDDETDRMTYEYAPMEVFRDYPDWKAAKRNMLGKEDAAFITLVGSDPEAFKGIDPKKMAARSEAAYGKMQDFYKLQSTMSIKWNVSGVATRAWAAKVFPDMNVDVAVTRLWEAIFATVRIGDGDVVEKWIAHAESLKEKTKILTAWQLKSLHYENSLGTDFTVGLVENHFWEGGADTDKVTGARFFANMPTEEVFTMPDRRKAEGVLCASLPLSYRGNLVENFRLTFKDGMVTAYEAEKGRETLKAILETDEGARRLGECALVPFPSPVSSQGILFLETLFDENAACHFALGACYETNLSGGTEMTEEELNAHGGNTSIAHVDFMVGTKDLHITGITKNGETVEIFRDGTWAF